MVYFGCGFAYEIELILVVDLDLHIKLGLDYEILNLGLVEFILIYPILSLVDCTCIFGY